MRWSAISTCRGDFSDAEIATLRDAFNTHGLLLFRDQDISPEAHVAFSRRFGELEHHVLSDALLDGLPEIYILSNLKKDGKRVGRAGAGHYWHSDLSYMAQPSLGSLLRAIEVPEVGGDTMFANLALAYDALSAPMRSFLEGLEAEHSFAKVQSVVKNLGLNEPITPEQLAKTPPVIHPPRARASRDGAQVVVPQSRVYDRHRRHDAGGKRRVARLPRRSRLAPRSCTATHGDRTISCSGTTAR